MQHGTLVTDPNGVMCIIDVIDDVNPTIKVGVVYEDDTEATWNYDDLQRVT